MFSPPPELTGDFTQNVNFAIKTERVLDSLRGLGIKVGDKSLRATDQSIIDTVQKAVVRISIYGP